MKTWRDGTATVLALVLIFSVLATAAQARLVRGPRQPGVQYRGPGNEFVLEGGLALPFGDLSDEYWTTDVGMEAGAGYELGFRYRYYVAPRWALSPSFHYVRFGTYEGYGDFPEGDDLGFYIRGSLYRYALDGQYFFGNPLDPAQFYLTGGIALSHNIYRDELQYYGVYKTAMDTASFNLGAGAKFGFLELSGTYHFNRFSTSKITTGPAKVDYNWDYAILSLGFAFGRY